MSKHPSNNTKRNLLRRSLAGILTLALLLGLLPSTLVTAHAASWADSYVQTLVDWGVMRGDVGGNMAPDRSITRAEFVTMMNRAYGYTKLNGHPFTDVRSRDWYNEDIDIAYNIGYFKGTGPTTASPNDTLTREQAAVLLARNMMMQETVGETLGFSDSRTLSDWSRGLVGAAAANGIISGYEDGSFQPFQDITRGEVAAMLVRAIGTPIQAEGDHTLGNVYGNVTVNTSGVRLRDGVIVGNLYLTGGIDLGDVLLENVTVLGEIIVSGGGESNSSQSSIILRNVVADNMVVDSIGSQFVTLRAEGNTDIPTTFVRTSAYVDDSSLSGYGLSHITLDGENGALYQLAGNIKEVLNKTPGSDLQIVQGTANKVTMDEYATGSSVLVDGDAVVGDLNLDVATDVTGTGDIKNLNVGAAGSTVEQLPDNIDIRPGITTDINGSQMNSSQAAESSAAPKLLAGYPAVRKIAPTNAELVFRTNKTGTIYWAVSAVSDGSVSEADLLNPPVYGNRVLASGTVTANAANTDYTARVNGLTTGGSYYVTAMLVDGRNQHSPIKVTSFTTPDSTVPAFANGYPVMSKITCEDAQVTVMTTKSCLLYYALLPAGAAAPTTAEFKAAAIPGNLGYGSMSVTKNVTIPFPVNDNLLDEKTNYVLYLWLTDHDGAQSMARPVAVNFTTPDETPPLVTDIQQLSCTETSITLSYTIDEPANLVWAIVTEGNHNAQQFLNFDWTETRDPNNEDKSTLKFTSEADLLAAKVRLMSGNGAIQSSATTNRSPFTINNLDPVANKTSSYVLYYIAHDRATASGNLSAEIKALRVHTEDLIDPTAKLSFTNIDQTIVAEMPQVNAGVSIIFSENVQSGTRKDEVFLNLYEKVTAAYKAIFGPDSDPSDTDSEQWNTYNAAKSSLATALAKRIILRQGPAGTTGGDIKPLEPGAIRPTTGTWIDWRNAVVEPLEDGSVEIRLPGPVLDDNGDLDYSNAGIQLEGGKTYYFHLTEIYDMASPPRKLNPHPTDLEFTTMDAQVNLYPGIGNVPTIQSAIDKDGNPITLTNTGDNPENRVDYHFKAVPQDVQRTDPDLVWDMLIWFMNFNVTATIYYRYIDENQNPVNLDGTSGTNDSIPWIQATPTPIPIPSNGFTSMAKNVWKTTPYYEKLSAMLDPLPDTNDICREQRREYAIHLNTLEGDPVKSNWNQEKVVMRVSVVTGTAAQVTPLAGGDTGTRGEAYDRSVGGANQARAIERLTPFTMSQDFNDDQVPEINTQAGVRLVDRTANSAKITLRLTGPGQVDYLAIPLTYIENPETQQTLGDLDEASLKKVEKYEPALTIKQYETDSDENYPELINIPLMVGDLNRTGTYPNDADMVKTVEVPRYTDFSISNKNRYDGLNVKLGNTTPAERTGDLQTIDLTDLQANTVYILCLLPSGLSAAAGPDTTISCFRFTTSKEDIPKLELGGVNQPTIDVNVETGNSAYMYWYLILKGSEDSDPNVKRFTRDFKDIANGDFLTSRYGNTTLGGNPDMDVLEAMRTKVNNNGFQGTVFDIYAREEEKDVYRDLILDSSSASEINQATIAGGSGNTPIYLNNRTTLDLGSLPRMLGGGTQYTLIAMAKRTQDSTKYSFAAWSPVSKGTGNMPMLLSATRDGTIKQMTAPARGVSEAYINLEFSGDLYNWVGNKAYPIDNCPRGTHLPNPTEGDTTDTTYYEAGSAAGAGSTITVVGATDHEATDGTWDAPTRTIRLKITNLFENSPATITFNRYKITDVNGAGVDRDAFLSLTIEAYNFGTDAAPDWRPIITSTLTPSTDRVPGWVNAGVEWNQLPKPATPAPAPTP